MKILSIDLGTYSVKFLDSTIDRKAVGHQKVEEYVIDDYRSQFSEETTIDKIHRKILADYFTSNDISGHKVIYQLPNSSLTTRFLTLPTTNKKKADLMVPFQLDKDLPFPVSESHYVTQYVPTTKEIHTITSIVEGNRFEAIFNHLDELNVLPDYLTNEISLFQNLAFTKKIDDPICILDLGHETTKGYFILDRRVAANHISYVAGKNVTENIAEGYEIPLEEAVSYKHRNSFFLTQSLLNEADEDQKEFALLMQRIFKPLIDELKEWQLGFRATHGKSITKVYLTGGTSKIKNICNYFTQTLGLKTEILDIYEASNLKYFSDERFFDKRSYLVSHMMGQSLVTKFSLANFRKGQFAATETEDIPLHSSTFLAFRVAMVSLIILIALIADRVFMAYEEKALNRNIIGTLKSPILGLNPSDRNRFRKTPNFVLNKLKNKQKQLNKDIEILKLVSHKNSLHSFFRLNKLLKSKKSIWKLVKYESSKNFITARFLITDDYKNDYGNQSKMLKEQLSSLPELKLQNNSDQKIINIEFKGE